MDFLEPQDVMALRAAEGWLGLGDPVEANEELARLTPAVRSHPDVLAVRYEICAKARRWEAALDFAREILKVAPNRPSGWIQQSFALHELQRTKEALETLLPAVEKFPNDITVRYNLACYECVLGNIPKAKRRLAETFDLSHAQKSFAQWRLQALRDTDLRPLWEYLKHVIS